MLIISLEGKKCLTGEAICKGIYNRRFGMRVKESWTPAWELIAPNAGAAAIKTIFFQGNWIREKISKSDGLHVSVYGKKPENAAAYYRVNGR